MSDITDIKIDVDAHLCAMGRSGGFSLANFKILLRYLSEMFICFLTPSRGMPAFQSSTAALFSVVEKGLLTSGLTTRGMMAITGQSDGVRFLT
jgi:hypothetical protein